MSQDIQIFKEHFKGYDLNYRLIGGQACNILLDNLGIEFRTTKDFDIILLVDKLNEKLNEEFIKVFWDFIKKEDMKELNKAKFSVIFTVL